ncbi:hypothetical protein LTR53_016186, partial [Teratosphaeriaceae sp. CCFEE 6253]
MCIYDTTRYACTGEEISLVQACPMYREGCIPHIRQILYRTAVCRLCALAGLEDGAWVATLGRCPEHGLLQRRPGGCRDWHTRAPTPGSHNATVRRSHPDPSAGLAAPHSSGAAINHRLMTQGSYP